MKNVGTLSALIYTSASLVITVLFTVASLGRNYSAVERIGGAAWVFLLSMIILMPLVIPAVKKRLGGGN